MIPTHILDNLDSDNRVAILNRRGDLQFLVHGLADDPAAIRALAARDGSEVLATHLQDKTVILELVAARERDIGGEA